jgi:3-oxoacyl-[acyl-carrier-protein] synthase-3
MATFSVNGLRICGIAAAVPKATESNFEYDRISEQERNLLVKTTGVAQRHIATEGQTTSDLCYSSAEELISL